MDNELDLTPPDWLPGSLEAAWALLSTYPLLLAASIVVVGIGLAFLLRGILLYWGVKVTRRTPTELDDRLLRLAAFAMVLIIGYLTLVAAVQVLPLSTGVRQVVVRILVSLLVLHLLQSALKAANLGLQFLGLVRNRYAFIEERTLPLFDLISTILILAIASYALFLVWEIDPTAWLASAGVIGIAVGFAARDTLANLFAGFSIITDAPCKLGDYVVLDSGERGEVTAIGMRSTRILTRDDVEIVVPNSQMANSKIINQSGGPWVKFRTRLEIGVAYGSDVDQVVEVLEGVAREHEGVCDEPECRVRMRGFGDSSLDFELLCWVDHPSDRGRVTHELFMEIYRALGREGIEIPFPQRDLWVRDRGPTEDS